MLASGQDAGVNVLASTLIPDCAAAPDSVTFVAAVNSGLTTWTAANGIPLANTFGALEEPGNPGCLNPIYSIDGVHPNDAGTVVETFVWMGKGQW
jgi:hypothetical protein